MARMMALEHKPAYRAVILRRYSPDADKWHFRNGVGSYTDSEGKEYQYHEASVYGPFYAPGQARAAITRATDYDFVGKRGLAEMDTFIEETSPGWTKRS